MSVGVTEAGYGPSPIVAIHVGATFFAPDLLAIFDQPRAAVAVHEFLIKNSQGGCHPETYFSGDVSKRIVRFVTYAKGRAP